MIKLAFNKVIHKSIKFYEDKHIYELYNSAGQFEKKLVSGTTFLNKFFPKFERDLIASRVAKRDGKTMEEVIDEWSVTAKIATDFGTKVHLFAESLVLNKQDLPTAENEKEEKYFFAVTDYLEKTLNNGWDLVEAEKIIFNNNIAGMADLLFVNHKKKLYSLEDWKTNKSIDFQSFNGREFGFEPISSLHNCNYEKYMLQMGLYTRLLLSGKFLDFKYEVQNKLLHINSNGIMEYVPSLETGYKNYTKLMEQKHFKVRVRS